MTNNEIALAWYAAGFNVIRAHEDGTKAPLGLWTSQYKEGPIKDNVLAAFGDGAPERQCWGILCGEHSGGLEMFELEGRAVAEGWLPRFRAAVTSAGLDDLWARLSYLERTPSGGLHWLFRVVDANGMPSAIGNQKLAMRKSEEGNWEVCIETRGQGGFTVMAPSGGPGIHQSDGYWEVLRGEVGVVPIITTAERDALYAVARSLDEKPARTMSDVVGERRAGPTNMAGTGSPFDDFEANTDWEDILEPAGWTCVKGEKHEERFWLRPGKVAIPGGWSWSASTGRASDRDRMFVWSTSSELDTERPMTKQYVWGVLNGYGGATSEAAAELRRMGFGAPVREDWTAHLGEGGSGSGSVDGLTVGREATVWWGPVAATPVGHDDLGPIWVCDEFGRVPGEPLDDVFSDPDYPLFGAVRHYARSRSVAPISLLFATLARICAAVPPGVQLPPLTGARGSLNMIFAYCSRSGGGKSVLEGASADFLKLKGGMANLEGGVKSGNLSTGQGVAAAYLQWVQEGKGEQNGYNALVANPTMLFRVGEIQELEALKSKESTVGGVLREAWSGKQLGAENATPKLRRVVPEHAYRFVLTFGVQFKLAELLLNETDNAAGTGQRILWVPLRDRFMPREKPKEIQQQTWQMPSWTDNAYETRGGQHALHVCDTAAELIIRENERFHLEDSAEELNTHLLFCQLKLAAVIALSAGHLGVRERDWEIAGKLMEISIAVRGECEAAIKKVAAERNEKAAKARGVGRIVEEKIVAEATQVDRMRAIENTVMRRLERNGEAGETKSNLRQALRSDWRGELEAVLDSLIASKQVRFEDIKIKGKQVSSRWFKI